MTGMAKVATKGTPKPAARDIGIDVPVPERACDDHNCPFHGRLRVRGQTLDGVVELEGLHECRRSPRDPGRKFLDGEMWK